jgi:hypothetical protein
MLDIEKRKFNYLGYWGEKDDIEFDELSRTEDEEFTSLQLVRRRSRRVRLEKRLEWGATQIVDVRNKFLNKYTGLYKDLSL